MTSERDRTHYYGDGCPGQHLADMAALPPSSTQDNEQQPATICPTPDPPAPQPAPQGAGLDRLVGTVLTVCPPESTEFESEHVWSDEGDKCVNCGVGSAWLNTLADAVRRAAESHLAAATARAGVAVALAGAARLHMETCIGPRLCHTRGHREMAAALAAYDAAASLRTGAAPAEAAVPVDGCIAGGEHEWGLISTLGTGAAPPIHFENCRNCGIYKSQWEAHLLDRAATGAQEGGADGK